MDANHKPEIAVAIGRPLDGWGDGAVAFTGFVGFRPLQEIKAFVANIAELQRAIGNERLVQDFLDNPSKLTLRNLFSTLLTRGADYPDSVKTEVDALVRS